MSPEPVDPDALGSELDRLAARVSHAVAERRAADPKHAEPIRVPGVAADAGVVWADDFGKLTDVAIDATVAVELYERDVVLATVAAINKAGTAARDQYREWLQKESRFEW